jgi:hypothetical protein
MLMTMQPTFQIKAIGVAPALVDEEDDLKEGRMCCQDLGTFL